MRSLLLSALLILFSSAAFSQNFDLNLQVTQNDYQNSGTLKVKVFIKGTSSSFNIGTSSIRVFYNDAAVSLTTANYTAATGFTGVQGSGFYANAVTHSSQAGRDIASINITFTPFFGGAVGITVPTTWTEVGELEFSITDVTGAKSMDFGGISTGQTGETVVLINDNTTAAGAGGSLWDDVIWNGSAWTGGNGTSGAPNHQDGVKSLQISSGTASIGDLVHVDSLYINTGATLNLDVSGSDQGHLFVTSNSATQSGTFNINATSNGYAQYIGPAVSAVVDQYVGNSAGWRHLGWPVNANLAALSGVTLNYGGGSSGNVYTFSTGFAWTAASASTETPGRAGVSVYMGGANFPVTDGVVSWTGTTNNGAQANTYSYSGNPIGDANFDGWNLVANTYPSNLDWHAVDDQQSGIYNSISTWDASTSAYKTYNSSTQIGDGQRYVAPGQSVWVKTSTDDNGKSLNLAAADRTFTGGNIFIGDFKQQNTNNGPTKNIALHITDTSGHSDNAYIHFHDQSIANYDAQYDAHKPFNVGPNPNLYSLAQSGEKLAINGYGSWAQTHIVPVGFESDQVGSIYTISLNMLDIDPTWGDIYLVDHFAGVTHNLTQNGDYTFLHSAAAPDMRFQVQFVQSAVGLAENRMSDQIKVWSYENTVAISRPNPAGNLKVVLYNLAGQKVFEDKFGADRLVEFSTNLPKAYYIVKAQDANGVAQSETIIIQ